MALASGSARSFLSAAGGSAFDKIFFLPFYEWKGWKKVGGARNEEKGCSRGLRAVHNRNEVDGFEGISCVNSASKTTRKHAKLPKVGITKLKKISYRKKSKQNIKRAHIFNILSLIKRSRCILLGNITPSDFFHA